MVLLAARSILMNRHYILNMMSLKETHMKQVDILIAWWKRCDQRLTATQPCISLRSDSSEFANSVFAGTFIGHMHCHPGFCILALWIFGVSPCCGGCPVCCRMHSSISGLYPLDASSVSPWLWNPNCLQTLPDVIWGKKSPRLKTSRVYSESMWCVRKGHGYSRLSYSSALPLGKLWDLSAPVSSPVNGGNTKSKYDKEMK